MSRPLSIADQERIHSALVQADRAACHALALCAGKTPQQIAAEVAARAIAALRSKALPEAAQREVAP